MMTQQELTILLKINAETSEGKAALQEIAKLLGDDLPAGAQQATSGMSASLQQMRDDLNAAFTFSIGQLMADGLQSGVAAVKQFTADSIEEFLVFENAMTGVEKTTGIPKEAIADLAAALRQSAIDLKGLGEGAATEMANITTIAGQLGVAQEKIAAGKFKDASYELAGFAEIIAKGKIALSEFTGGAEEVATKVAQVSNLYQKTAGEAENILSVYNGLGDTLATDANKISDFMASFTMAPQLKISFEDAAAIGATLTALGLDAGAAATNYQGAISQILTGNERSTSALTAALQGSSDAQQQLEALLGRSKGATEDFYSFFKQALAVDAVAATNALIDAIGEMPDSVMRTQTSLDIFGREGARTMNTLIGNTGSLNENIQKSRTLYQENISIQAEFERAISKQGTAFDEIKTKVGDLKIEIGQHLVAALSEAAKTDISPAIDQFSTWLKTSQEAKTFFESTLPSAISGTSSALSTVAQAGAAAANKIAAIGTDIGTFIGDLQTGQLTLGDVGQALGEMLGLSGQSAQQLGAFAQNASNAFSEFFTGVASGKITIGEISAAIGESVGLSQEHARSVGEFAQSVATGVGDLYEGLSSGKITLGEVGQAVGDMVGLSQERLSAMKGFATNAITGFQELYTGISNGEITFRDLAASGTEFFDALTEQFGLDAAYDAFTAQLDTLKAGWADWKANSETYTNAFFDGITESFGLSEAYDALQGGLGNLKAGWSLDWSEWTAAPKAAFLGLWQETVSAGSAAFTDLKSDVIFALADIGDAIAQPFRDGATAIGNAFTGLGAKLGKEFDTATQKALDFYQSVTKNETIIGLLEKVTDKIIGVPPAMEDATTAQDQLTESIYAGVDALSAFGIEAYGQSVYPDTTIAIQQTQEAQRGLTDEIVLTTEQVGVLGQQASATFAQFAGMMDGLGKGLSGLGGSLGDLGGLLGIKELGGLGGMLGDISKYTQIPSILGDIGGQLGGIFGGLGDIGGLLGGEGLSGLLGASGLGSLGSMISGLSGTLSGGLGGAVSMVSGALGGLGSTVAGLGSSLLGGLGGAVSSITGALGGLGGAIGGLLPALGPIGLAGGAIALAWEPLKGLFKSIFGEAQSEGNKANETWRRYVGDVIDSSGQMEQALTNAYKTFSASGSDYMTFLDNAGPATRALHDELGGLDGVTLSGLISAMEAAGVSSEKSAQVALQQVAAFAEMGYSAEEASAKIQEMIAATQGASDEGQQANNIFDQTSGSIQNMNEQVDTLSGSLLTVSDQLSGTGAEGLAASNVFVKAEGSASALNASVNVLSGDVADLTTQLSDTGAEGLAASNVFVKAEGSASALNASVNVLSGDVAGLTTQLSGTGAEGLTTSNVFVKADGSASALGKTVNALSGDVGELTRQMTSTGVSAIDTSNMFEVAGHSADGLQGDMGALKSMSTDVVAQLTDIQHSLAAIPNEKQITISVTGDPIPAMAIGGTAPGGLVLYGEQGPEGLETPGGLAGIIGLHGPEIGILPRNARVIPHAQITQFLREHPYIQTMAAGGIVQGMPVGMTIQKLEVNAYVTGNTIDQGIDLNQLTTDISRRLAPKIREVLRSL